MICETDIFIRKWKRCPSCLLDFCTKCKEKEKCSYSNTWSSDTLNFECLDNNNRSALINNNNINININFNFNINKYNNNNNNNNNNNSNNINRKNNNHFTSSLSFYERWPEYPEKKLSEERAKPTCSTPTLIRPIQRVEPGKHFWEASAITTAPALFLGSYRPFFFPVCFLFKAF